MKNQILGAYRIVEGLLLGDENPSQDLNFILKNKITHVVNCAGRQVANKWEGLGVKYLTFSWLDHSSQVVLDSDDSNLKAILQFIEPALQEEGCILVHSEKATSRAPCIAMAYLMHRFSWSFKKALEFIKFKVPRCCIKRGPLKQLQSFESRLKLTKTLTTNWEDCSSDPEEAMLANTFINTKKPLKSCFNLSTKKKSLKKISFCEEVKQPCVKTPTEGFKSFFKENSKKTPRLNKNAGSFIVQSPKSFTPQARIHRRTFSSRSFTSQTSLVKFKCL